LALENGARIGWSEKVQGELQKITSSEDRSLEINPKGSHADAHNDTRNNLGESDKNFQKLARNDNRIDLTKLLTYTIDGADTKDIDDALSLKVLENGDTLLYVHIADVAEYVKEGSALDEEALKRGTSIYLCDVVIPMLPKEISNGVCSLNPGEEKNTLTCEMLINKKGHILKSKVYESCIVSNFRLTYKEVEEMIQGRFLPFQE